MRRRLFGRSPRQIYPIRQCHFCNIQSHIVPPHPASDVGLASSPSTCSREVSVDDPSDVSMSTSSTTLISTGTEANWYCSSCQCWNRADAKEIGGISSWELKMSDERQNVDNLQLRAVSTSSITKPTLMPSHSPFCHSCQTNQILILSILANGDTDEMSDEEIAQWQVSLEDRYPPVCEVCQEMVKTKIEKADKIARRLIWNGWLKKSKDRKASGAPSKLSRSDHQDPRSTSLDGYESSTLSFTWYVQLLVYLSSTLLSALSIWYRPAFGAWQHIGQIAAVCISFLICKTWNPSMPRQLHLRRRLSPSSHIKVEGLSQFRRAQLTIFILQITDQFDAISAAQPLVKSDDSRFYAAIIMSSLHILIAISALRVVKVIEPPSISLKSKIPSVNQRHKRYTSTSEPALHGLSLESESRFSDQSKKGAVPMATEQESDEQKREETGTEMDWTPTLDAATSSFNNGFQLGPQRFFEPLRHTGLEDMLDKTLALGAQPSNNRVGSKSGSSSKRLFVLLSIPMILSIITAGIIIIFPNVSSTFKLNQRHL